MNEEKKNVAFYENGSWYHRTKELRSDGTVKYGKKGGFKSSAEAEKSYRSCENAFKKAVRGKELSGKNAQEVMFKEYLIYWFEEVFSKRIETTTRMITAYAVYDLILPKLKQDIKLKYLSADFLDELLGEIAAVTPSAGNKAREVLNIALKEAVIEGKMKTNPVAGTKSYLRKEPSIKILSKEEVRHLLKAAKCNKWYLEILLGLFCGLRKGEILGLKFSDVDFEENTLTVNRQLVLDPIIPENSGSKVESYNMTEKDPKSENSFRTLRVPNLIMQELRKRQRRVEKFRLVYGEDYVDNDYVCSRDDGKGRSSSAMNSALSKLCERNGLPHITVHGLRHMYATILLEKGVSLHKISALLGHSSVNTTFEYYCDMMDENGKIIAFMNNTFVPKMEVAV